MSGRGKRAIKQENGQGNGGFGGQQQDGGPSMGIEVKTKFPVARIKRIMQADEEVGKVAQVTPVAVCTFTLGLKSSLSPSFFTLTFFLFLRVAKALELFMISLVTKSAALAREGNSKRVTAQHLKRAIEADEQLDFLKEIVSKVVEGPEAGGKRLKDDDSSGDEAAVTKKKAKGGRKKKGEA